MTIDIPKGYEALGGALAAAVEQAARGKGSERHAEKGEAFSDQLIFEIPRRLGACGSGFLLGQAVKKIYESARLEPERARAEILGAINYLAAAWSRLYGARAKDELVRRIREANPAVYPPEDVDAPRFQKGGSVEYRLPDGTWAPASFVCMDGGYAVLASGGERLEVLAFDVRPAEKS